MINVNDVKIFIDFIANKEQSGTSYSIDQLNNLFYAANIDLFKQRYGLPEEYVSGMPIPRQGWQLTQKMTDDLGACKVVSLLTVSDAGVMTLPDNYIHKSSIIYEKILNNDSGVDGTVVTQHPVDIIDDDKWAERCSNSLKGPSLDFPICNFLNTTIRFKPINLKQVEFSYLRFPNRPIWGFTTTTGVEVYSATASTNFEWNEVLFTDIAKIILSYLSINLRDSELKEAMDVYKNKGY